MIIMDDSKRYEKRLRLHKINEGNEQQQHHHHQWN